MDAAGAQTRVTTRVEWHRACKMIAAFRAENISVSKWVRIGDMAASQPERQRIPFGNCAARKPWVRKRLQSSP